MSISFKEDICSVTDLRRNTREILEHVHRSGRPLILTVNCKADAVLIDVEVYENQLKAASLAKLLLEAEMDIVKGNVRPVGSFLDEFKRERKI